MKYLIFIFSLLLTACGEPKLENFPTAENIIAYNGDGIGGVAFNTQFTRSGYKERLERLLPKMNRVIQSQCFKDLALSESDSIDINQGGSVPWIEANLSTRAQVYRYFKSQSISPFLMVGDMEGGQGHGNPAVIIFGQSFMDSHNDDDVVCLGLHEIAHALGFNHSSDWTARASVPNRSADAACFCLSQNMI